VHSFCLDLGKRVVPPLAEQSRIVTRVAQLRRLCADLRQRLAASQSTQAYLAEALGAENP
jgi:type I restriction enzyme S subunit